MADSSPAETPTILLAMENGTCRQRVAQTLEGHGSGYRVDARGTASEALAALQALRPELILCGETLPDSLGTDLVGRLCRYHREIPVLMLAEGAKGAALEAIRQGAVDCMRLDEETLAKLPLIAGRLIEESRERRHPVLASIAHDLRTPLTGLSGLLDLLESGADGPLQEAQRERLRRIRATVAQMISLVDQVGELGAVESGGLKFSRKPVPLAEVISPIRDELQAFARSRAVDLRITWPPDLPPVLGDPARIRQLFASLLSLVLRRAEGAVLGITFAHDERMIEVTLREEPRALPVEALPPGFEASNGTRAGEPAALSRGIGLSLLRGLVRLHGGTFRAGDRDGGVIASFTLPVAGGIEPLHQTDKPRDIHPSTRS